MDDAQRPIRLGFIGGGGAAMIGPVHRRAAVYDGEYAIVAGVLSSDPERSRAHGLAIGLAKDRAYPTVGDMLAAEARRDDGVQALAIVTPNETHFPYCMAALDAGLHVICDKPMTNTLADAEALREKVRASGRVFCLTHTYAGYPMIRQARALVVDGEIEIVRAVQIEYLGSGLAAHVEAMPDAPKRWRLDPARGGPSLVLGDIGTHAHHMASYVTNTSLAAVSADVAALRPGRIVHDYASLRLRFDGGARGAFVLCPAAPGVENHIALRVIGDRATLEWSHAQPNHLRLMPLDGPPLTLSRGQKGLSAAAGRATRLARTGHPEGVTEAFATLYRDAAAAMRRRDHGTPLPEGASFPDAADGLAGVRFVHAAVASSARDGAWVEL